MAACSRRGLLLLLPFIAIVRCSGDEDGNLLQGINRYRTSLNLTSLTRNSNADCLAGEVAVQLKPQPCSNSTGSDTVPGTEPRFANFPNLLSKCRLNLTTTRDGEILPACVPNLEPSLVLTNFTESQYSADLNDTRFAGIGIGSSGDWIVAILTTDTADGNYSPAARSGDDSAAAAAATRLVTGVCRVVVGMMVAGVFTVV